jgi:S-adenosyl-L-methionine hydrolase (adenosine-forming)
MGAVVTLTTDFGLSDAYVAIMKGVILRINPEADIVDICHNIQPQNIRQAAFVLGTAYNYFPAQTVHLVVVDPGVGTNRRPIILKTPKAYFVAPDNGVLSYILDNHVSQPVANSPRVTLGPDLKAYVITRSEYWLKPVSNTFHGRDIFAPVAARLSLGLMASSLGDSVDSITAFPIPRPYRQDGLLIGHVLHIDNFGNVITDIREDSLPSSGQSVTIIIGGYSIRGLSGNYDGGEGPLALFGSSGYLEIALKNASAAAFLKAGMEDEIRVKIGD